MCTCICLQMGVVGEKLDIDFVISTGDNIYDDGIANTSDPLFKECFTNIYTAQSLQKPWYIGNALCITCYSITHITIVHALRAQMIARLDR